MEVQLTSFQKKMRNIDFKSKLINTIFDLEVYKCVITVLVIFSSIPLFYEVSVLLKFTHIWSLGILIYDYLNNRYIYRDKYFIYKIAFVSFYFITMILNLDHLRIANISEAMYFVFSLLILTSSKQYGNDYLKNNIARISKLYLTLVTPLNIVSIFLFLQNKSYSIIVNGSPRFIGMYEHHGRLSGFFGNPVDLAFFSLIGLFLSIIMVQWYQKNKQMQSIFIFSFVVNLSTLLFSNTRTHFFTLIIICLVYILRSKLGLFNQLIRICYKYKFYILFGILGLFFFVFSTGLLQNLRYFNFSLNGRLELWLLGIQVFVSTPLFGVGFGNFGSAVAQLGLNTATVIGGGVHQGLLELLVHTGIMGTIALFLLIYKTLSLDSNKFRLTKNPILNTVWFFIISLLITSFVDSTIVFPMYITNVLFFISIGYINSYEGSDIQDAAN